MRGAWGLGKVSGKGRISKYCCVLALLVLSFAGIVGLKFVFYKFGSDLFVHDVVSLLL